MSGERRANSEPSTDNIVGCRVFVNTYVGHGATLAEKPGSVRAEVRRAVARWLRAAMGTGGKRWTQTALARAAGVSRETIWSILNQKADAQDETLAALAEALGTSPPIIGEVEPGTSLGEAGERVVGSVWSEPTEAEEQFRTFLRYIETTTRGMIADPDLFEPADTRQLQLGVIRAIQKSAEASGRPVPPWLLQIYNEVIGGTFK